MGEIKDPSSIQPLTDSIDLGNTDAAGNALNKEVVTALAAIGDPAVIPTLQKLLRSRDPYTKIAAIDALGDLKATAAAPQLEAIAGDPRG